MEEVKNRIEAVEFALASFIDHPNDEQQRLAQLISESNRLPFLKPIALLPYEALQRKKESLQREKEALQREKELLLSLQLKQGKNILTKNYRYKSTR